MEPGQIEKLTLGYGSYINNYTSEILLKGILRQSVLSSTFSGMQMHAPQNHALLRFKQLLWYDLPELHDKVFRCQWEFPNAWESTSLHPIHFLSATEAARLIYQFDYDCWALSWIGIRIITFEQILDRLQLAGHNHYAMAIAQIVSLSRPATRVPSNQR